MKYEEEEKEIIEASKELEMLKAAAESTFTKDKRITIRLYDHDLRGIQKKALQLGIPYQTLISGIIHRYVEGDLISRDDR
jgi:predicted DNA binding CopG/RHH family protein